MQTSSAKQTRQSSMQAPLLGDEACCDRQEYDYFVDDTRQHHNDDDDDVVMDTMTMMDNDNDDNDDSTSLCCNDTVVIWIILPFLLLSQFAMAFLLHDETTAHLSWPICNFSIFLFCVTAWLFRHACVDAKIEKPVLLLLAPEICMDIILALVLFNQVELGFIVMLASMLVLSGFVVVTTAHYLYSNGHVDNEEEEEEVQEGEKIAMTQACIV